jgi:hypothetical protein
MVPPLSAYGESCKHAIKTLILSPPSKFKSELAGNIILTVLSDITGPLMLACKDSDITINKQR